MRAYPPEYFAAAHAATEPAPARTTTVPPGRLQSLADFASDVPRQGRKQRAGMEIRVALDQAEVHRKHDSWSGAEPRHFVAMWALIHAHVYKVEPDEIADQRAWTSACVAVARLLADQFDGDGVRMIDFVKWSWTRAITRKKKGSSDRLKWQFLFNASAVTDYRVAMASKQEAGK